MTTVDSTSGVGSEDELTLVVTVDDLVRAMEYNGGHPNSTRRMLLRFDRPLEGRVEASVHTHQEGSYFPGRGPLVLAPEAFVEDRDGKTAYPEAWQVNEAAKEVDGVDDLGKVSDETLAECWGVHTEVWESEVRRSLRSSVDISTNPDTPPEFAEVEYVSESQFDKAGEEDSDAPEFVPDGGEEIRDLQNDLLQGSHEDDDLVRRYSADGTLYAYRDGGEHVVVSRGREAPHRWTKRVPAERTAVVEGEQLWTIPDNWTKKLTIRTGETSSAIYRIPGSGVDVLVSIPSNTYLIDAWYGVKKVGQMEISFDEDEVDGDAFAEHIEGDTWDHPRFEEVLDTVNREFHRFERELVDDINEFAEEMFWDSVGDHEPVVENYSVRADYDIYPVDEPLNRVFDFHPDLAKPVTEDLRESGAVPYYPTLEVAVSSRKSLPEGFDATALVEAGCSPSEAVDYQMVEIVGKTPSEWADVRGTDESTVSTSVTEATRKLRT